MKKTKISKNKILLEYNVPIRVKGFDNPVSNLDIKVRYRWGKDWVSKEGGFVMVLSSIDKSLETLAFKWKICNAHRIGSRYVINGVKPHYIRKKVDGLDLLVVSYIEVEDERFIQRLRDKKITDVLGI